MQKSAKLVLLLASLVPLSGCASGTAAIVNNCNIGNTVSVSKHDTLTEQTAQEIDANNKSREAAGCAAKS